MSDQSYSITPATSSDVPVLGQIFSAAFANDRPTQLKSLGKDPDYTSSIITEPLSSWLQRPTRYSVLKATDSATGEIIGWVCWGFHGYEESSKPLPTATVTKSHGERTDETAVAKDVSVPGTGQKQVIPEPTYEDFGKTGVALLESISSQSMKYWLQVLMPEGHKCMFMGGIVVSPAHQSCRLGSALIRWGTARADTERVSCWVHASEAGHKAFAKAGFDEVGRLDLNLDDFAPGPYEDNGKSEGWGKYTYRYMLRPAQ